MTRFPFASALAVLFTAATASAAFAQTTPTTPPAQSPPATRAKWVAPIKGIAKIQVIRGNPKPVGKEVWTVMKVKNISSGAIALLRADEYWYDTKRQLVTGDTYRHRQPLNPGEVVEFTMKSPIKPNLQSSRIQFEHANGKIDAAQVKEFK
jgi:hypothetical protein